MLTMAFWKAALERAVKTVAQTVAAGFFLSQAGPVNAFELDYKAGLGLAAGGALLSLLTSVGSHHVGDNGPSLGPEKLG